MNYDGADGLTTEELQRIFDAAEAHSPRLTALVYALFFTGSRISEILGADVRDYRLELLLGSGRSAG